VRRASSAVAVGGLTTAKARMRTMRTTTSPAAVVTVAVAAPHS
jgi:hypothetical protein